MPGCSKKEVELPMRQLGPFADLIRKRRKELELTLSTVATAAGWSVPYLSELERGVKTPALNTATLERLGAALDLDIDRVVAAALAAKRSVEFNIDGRTDDERKAVMMFARRFQAGSLSQDESDQVIKLFESFRKEGENSR